MKMSELTVSDFKCDWRGCRLLPFAEVFNLTGEGEGGWSYLCLLHLIKARVRGDSIMWSIAAWIDRLPMVHWLWNRVVR